MTPTARSRRPSTSIPDPTPPTAGIDAYRRGSAAGLGGWPPLASSGGRTRPASGSVSADGSAAATGARRPVTLLPCDPERPIVGRKSAPMEDEQHSPDWGRPAPAARAKGKRHRTEPGRARTQRRSETERMRTEAGTMRSRRRDHAARMAKGRDRRARCLVPPPLHRLLPLCARGCAHRKRQATVRRSRGLARRSASSSSSSVWQTAPPYTGRPPGGA